jgi:AcrR family transcriptional regulator
MSTETRTYRKRRRAEAEQRTRLRITEAAVKLHGTVGPARTTVSAVAKEAGVQRATVYRHFPTEADLFVACSGHWLEHNPPPDPQAWGQVADPTERLRRALGELYTWYARTEGMLERTSRDAPLVAAMAGPVQGMLAHLRAAADAIMSGRPERGAARKRARAAVGHAIAFSTWQSLTRDQGLNHREAVALMVAMIEA